MSMFLTTKDAFLRDLFKEIPWKAVRPGVLQKDATVTVVSAGVSQEVTLTKSEWICQTCKAPLSLKNDSPVLKDSLWKELYPENGVVCSDCLEQKLGRVITEDDLKPNVAVNVMFRNRKGIS